MSLLCHTVTGDYDINPATLYLALAVLCHVPLPPLPPVLPFALIGIARHRPIIAYFRFP